ncbi:MAG: hypothetical protein II771_07790, partial [Clostridia bacterium]|nr:hypothetical protein [Clostridia bacterium]
ADGENLPWVEYRLFAERAGRYLLSVGLANNGSKNTKDTVAVTVNGEEQKVCLDSAGTGGWYNVKLREIGEIRLPAGESALRIKTKANSSCGNYDYFVLTPIATEEPPVTEPSVTASAESASGTAGQTAAAATAQAPDGDSPRGGASPLPAVLGGAVFLAAALTVFLLFKRKRSR